jgi:hypothetical protein
MYPDKNQRQLSLFKLTKIYNKLGITKESVISDSFIIKLSIRDDDLGYTKEWNQKTYNEKQKILEPPDEKQRSEIAHHILDVIGLIPGPGDVADLLNVFLYVNEGKYSLAALSLMCMIPAIGTAVGIAIKTGKRLPAKIIFEHEDEIQKIVLATKQYVPNNDKIAEAVNEIISQIKMGADSIDLSTGKAVKSNINQNVANKAVNTSVGAWYDNPKWKEWFSTIISSCITKILNEVTEKETKTRLIRNLITRPYFNSKALINMGATKEQIEKLIKELQSENTEVVKFISSQFNTVLGDLRKNIRYRIITNESDALKYAPQGTLGQADIYNNEVLIFLPRLYNFAHDPKVLVGELMTIIRHETWHIIDFRFAEIFIKNNPTKHYQEFMPISNHSNIYTSISRNLNLNNLNYYDEKLSSYLANPTELFVRVKEMREFLGKKYLTALDLDNFRKMNDSLVSHDIKLLHVALQGVSNNSLKIIADNMNKVI